jgi:hypothetical protein
MDSELARSKGVRIGVADNHTRRRMAGISRTPNPQVPGDGPEINEATRAATPA